MHSESLKNVVQICRNAEEQRMDQHLVEQQIDTERERWASNLSIAIRTLRKHGFYVAQDPDATRQDNDAQKRQAFSAACVLLGVSPTPKNVGHQVVQALGCELLENRAVAAERLFGRSLTDGVPSAVVAGQAAVVGCQGGGSSWVGHAGQFYGVSERSGKTHGA